VPAALAPFTVLPCANSPTVAVRRPERCIVHDSVFATAPEIIAKCGTSGMPTSTLRLGKAHAPDSKTCVNTPRSSVVSGSPNTALSQTPQARRSIGTTTSPSAFSTSGTGGRGSRP
jgi:cysteine synthase